MVDQDSVQARKDASAAGAAENSGVGIDGDGASTADLAAERAAPAEAGTDRAEPRAEPDPVTGRREHATGVERAAENEDRDPVG
ncbi:MAG TPA: hypothetical protein VFP34_07290 [Microlunatus sp.]|nr:hypothetical protein [Microlunatus sp.]